MRKAIVLAVLGAACLGLRLARLEALPIFVDEGIHLAWAREMAATHHLLGITDGGRYLPIALYALVTRGATDPLWVARACSALAGLATVLGLVGLGWALDDGESGLVAGGLAVVAPLTLFYDRMALVDALLAALAVWSLVFAALWARRARDRWAVALGLTLGAAAVTKLYGALLLIMVPPLALAFWRSTTRVSLRRGLGRVYGCAVLVLTPLVLDLAAAERFVRETLWVFRPGYHGEPVFRENLGHVVAWPLAYLTPIGTALLGLGLVAALFARHREDAVPVVLWAGWSAFFVLTGGHNWFPRYLLPAVPPLFLVAARGARRLGGAAGGWSLAALFALAVLPFDLTLLVHPSRARLPAIDRWQYVEQWPSGYGLAEVEAFLGRAARPEGLVLLRDDRSGPLHEGLDLALERTLRGVEAVTSDLQGPDLPEALAERRGSPRPVYLALERPAAPALALDLSGRRALGPVFAALKPGSHREMALYLLSGEPPRRARPSVPVPGPGPAWHGPFVRQDLEGCAQAPMEGSGAACRRLLERGVGGSVRAGALLGLGEVLTDRGDSGAALALIQESERLCPGDRETAEVLASALEGLGPSEEALAIRRTLSAGEPANPRRRAAVAWNLARLGRLQEAVETYEAVLRLKPEDAPARNDLGVCLFLLGRVSEAEAAWSAARRLDPEGLLTPFNAAVAESLE